MKQIYITILLLFVCQLGLAGEKNTLLVPSATIAGTTTVCQNASSPLITFMGSGGTAPYTFTYRINGGPNLTVTTTSGNTITVAAPTGTAGTFTYTLVSVHDSTLPITEQTITGQTAVVTIITVGIVNPSTLVACLTGSSQTSAQVGLVLALPTPTSLIQTITINWGDGSSIQNIPSSNWNTPILYTYPLGAYTVTVTATTSLGCTTVRTYTAFVGSSPQAATLSLFANQATGCSPHTTQFTFGLPVSNSNGTNYSICFGDGSPCVNYIEGSAIPSSWIFSGTTAQFNYYTITHVYAATSCGNTVNLNGTTYNNVFLPSVITTNPCTAPQPQAGSLISVGLSPTASFTPNPIPNRCVNTPITLNNTSNFGGTIDPTTFTCTSTSPFYWTISPSGTGLWTASGLGSNNGFPNNELFWTVGSMTPSITFSQPGNYTIALVVKNSCGISTVSNTICIEPPLTPLFTLNTTSGCTPVAVTATNNTLLINQCSPPTYLWQVTHTPLYCATTTVTISNQTTANATYNFTEPGSYSIRLTVTNSCTPAQTLTQIVTVKKPPTVSIAAISNSCGTASITPNATVTNCAPTGGTLTYAWSFPGGTPSSSTSLNPGTISYPAGGPYSVSLVATNECGPSNTATQTFTVNIAPVITNTSLSQTICSGSTTTLVNLTANPTGTTFSWTATATAGISGFTPSGTTNTIPIQTISTPNTNPGTVTYVITPSVGGCPGTPVNYVITVNPAPTITTQPASSSVCLGGTPTPLTVALNTSSVTPTYQWYSNTSSSTSGGTLIPGATNATYNPPTTSAGTLYYYCIISLSTGGCSSITSNIGTVTITPVPTITTQPNPTQNLCVGITIPTPLTVGYTGGTGTVTYQWYSNSSPATTGGTLISGATNSNYTPPVFTTAATYYYYVVISLAGNNCGTITSNVSEVIVYNDPTVTTEPLSTQTLCQSATPTTLQVVVAGGNGTFTYQWYSNVTNNNTSGTAISGATSSNYIPPTSIVGTLYYYCIISQSTLGCSVKSTVGAVIINASPNIILQPSSSSLCAGGTPTALYFTYSNGVGTPTYQWYSNTLNDTTSGMAISGETNPTYTPPANTVGVLYYYCLVTFPSLTGSCSTIATATAAITVTPAAAINQQPLPNQSLCVGGTIPNTLTVSYINGTGVANYQWYSNTTSSTTGGTPVGSNAPNYTPNVFTTTGTYYYYVVISFSGSGCGAITSNLAQIDVVADPVITAQPLATQTVCQNSSATTLSVVASGGIGTTYTYQWYSSTVNSTASGTVLAGETNSTYSPPTITAGTLYYYCMITQLTGAGCNVTSAVAAVTVNLAPAVGNQPLSSTLCLGATPTTLSLTYVNGAGTPNYQWYANTTNSNSGGTPISGATNATFNPPATVAGTTYYYCEITFPTIVGSCSLITTNPTQVTINQNPVIASEATVICSSTTFTVTPTITSGNIIPISTTYTWTTPTINPAGSITGATAETVPQTSISQTLVNSTTSPATVTYTVTPTSGTCVGNSFTVTVTVNPSINPNVVVTNNTCFGVNTASITTNITGGIPFSSGTPYQLSWTGPNSFTSSATSISSLQPGNYNVTIADAGGCPFSNSYTIIEPTDIVITIDSENDITCYNANNGSINITVTGGTGAYSYNWTKNTAPYDVTEDISNLSPGTYMVTVTDVNNCGPKTASFTITEPPLLVVSLVSQTNILCYGAATGVIAVGIVGGTPNPTTFDYTYAWTGPNGFTANTQNLSNLLAGTYNLTVTDNNGCIKNLMVTLTQSTEIIIAYTTTPITCYGANNASMSVTLSGGNPPYQFQWSNLSTSLSQNNLSAGNYTITVTDNVGCIKTATIVIPEAPVFTVNPIVTQITCNGANNGSINLNLTGGIAPVALTWSDGSTAGLTRNNLAPGTYTATISDGTPCYIVRTFTIVQPSPLVLSANLTNAFDCTNASSGAINLVVAGGTLPYSYSWSNGAVTEDLSNLTSGNYLVTVRDANGCIANGQYPIIRQDPIVITVATQTEFDCAAHTVNQNFVAQVSGGIPPYQLLWSSGTISGANNEIMETNTNGTVLLTVTDSNSCTAIYTVTVDTPILGYPSFDTTSFGFTTYGLYAIGDPIQFQSTITGDYISVSWDFGDGTFSTEVNPIHTYVLPRDYIVTQTVTYPFGCVYVQTISLLIEKGYVLVVPTAFTPNNDSLNDTYRPVTKALKNVVLDIYDTWGSLVYSETGDVLVGWDGKIKGFNAENGNYYSKVSAETFYGTIVNSNQTFVLIK